MGDGLFQAGSSHIGAAMGLCEVEGGTCHVIDAVGTLNAQQSVRLRAAS